jgi:hypothetical protein
VLQSPRSEGFRSACTSPPARPTYVSDSVAADREIVRGSAIPAPSPCPFRTWNGFPHLSIPVLTARKKVNRSSCVDGRSRVTVFERGDVEFWTAGCWSWNSNHPISSCHVRRDRPFLLQISPSPGTQTQFTSSARSRELTETPPPSTRNQSAA